MMQPVKVADALAPDTAVLVMSLAGCSAARSAPAASGSTQKTYTQKRGSVQVPPSSPVSTLVAQPSKAQGLRGGRPGEECWGVPPG